MGVLLQDLRTLYGAYLAGQSDPLPQLPIQYADYAQWQRRSGEWGAPAGAGAVLARAVGGSTPATEAAK